MTAAEMITATPTVLLARQLLDNMKATRLAFSPYGAADSARSLTAQAHDVAAFVKACFEHVPRLTERLQDELCDLAETSWRREGRARWLASLTLEGRLAVLRAQSEPRLAA